MPLDDGLTPIVDAPLIDPAQADAAQGPGVLAVCQRQAGPRRTAWHAHARGQLVSADRGLLSVDTGAFRSIVPAAYVVWLPPGLAHAVQSHGPFEGWSAYIDPAVCGSLPAQPGVFHASALLRAAIHRLAAWTSGPWTPRQARLAAVVLDELAAMTPAPLTLPLPRDARLRRIAQALSDDPGCERRSDQWARWAGLSPRTLSRRFAQETGMSFTAWRTCLRVLCALPWLAEGAPVKRVAWDLGYSSVSAFIAAFRQVMGTTPAAYRRTICRAEGSGDQRRQV
jgi:AraC-like DNA-binding protein